MSVPVMFELDLECTNRIAVIGSDNALYRRLDNINMSNQN